jgi:hypothetical protein
MPQSNVLVMVFPSTVSELSSPTMMPSSVPVDTATWSVEAFPSIVLFEMMLPDPKLELIMPLQEAAMQENELFVMCEFVV